MTLIKKVKNDLFDYPNRYIMQLENGFKFSLDSVLLAEYADVKNASLVLDMCCGNAPIPLIQSIDSDAFFVGFEIQEDIALLGVESVEINNLKKRIKIINDDIKNIGNYYEPASFDVITCNPPYFKSGKNNCINKNDYLTYARHEILINLEEIFFIASKYLKNNGAFYLVHRPERLDEIILFGKKYNVNVKEIQFVTTKNDNILTVLIVKCVKNSRQGVKIKRIVDVNGCKTYQQIFR